ncbi:MAG: sulfurtransferase complex subunit TusB [Gammaproteobacteria bacterium]|nr:sulfurtransferase complex subunit TusB [Gammaproteobacteria bacterium]
MSTLHTVNKSPFEKNSLETCVRLASKGNAVLMYEDGVYGALKNTAVANLVKGAMSNLQFYVLGPDLKARGLDAAKVLDGIKVVNYNDFVKLSVENDKVQAWL